jgi:hypothetical protein
MNDGLFSQIFGELFTEEEWGLWAKGEFSLFDNYVERVGMSEEDADRLRNRFRPNKDEPKKTTPYQEFLKNPLTEPTKRSTLIENEDNSI